METAEHDLNAEFWGQKTPSSDVRRFLRAYRHRLRDWDSRRCVPDENAESGLNWGRDGFMARQLLEKYDYFRLLALLDQFFAGQAPRGATLSLVVFGKWLQGDSKPHKRFKDRSSSVRHGRWVKIGQIKKRHHWH